MRRTTTRRSRSRPLWWTPMASCAPGWTEIPPISSPDRRRSSPPPAPWTAARFWDVNDPYLYGVFTMLSVNGAVVDVCETNDRFPPDRVQGRCRYWRSLPQRPVCLAHRLRAALGQRLGGAWRRLSRLDARLHLALVRESNGQLCALDARCAPAGRFSGVRPPRHRPGLPGGRQGKAGDRPPSGTNASRSCATR